MARLDVAIMIEGQDGLTWPRWQRIARVVEASGYVGLFRSDHLIGVQGPGQDALELWASLTWLATATSRIEFGSLVSPVSLRNPALTAWTAAAVDDLSGGRLRLGLGAGWQEREHLAFGFELLPLSQRFDRFDEGLAVITRLLRSDEPCSFEGTYFRLENARLLPRPRRRGGPPIVIGGKGPRRTLALVARYADEWNTVSLPAAAFGELNTRLDALLRERGRAPTEVLRSLMTTVIFGRDETELRRRLAGQDVAELRAQGRIVGTTSEVVEQLQELAGLGLQRIMLRWTDFDDADGIAALAEAVLPRL